jgi:hypothetical protein
MGRIRVTERSIAAVALGALFLALGVLAVFIRGDAPGATALLAVGVLALGVATFSDRIGSLSFGGAKLELRDLARQRFALAAKRDDHGDAAGSAVVRRQAHGFQRLAGAYERLRRTTPPGDERTRVLDDIVGQASQLAQDTQFDPIDVWTWFDEGADESRVIVLGLMLGDSRLCDFYCAMDAIENSRSAFEQYYGLVVAQQMIGELNPLEREWLRRAVTEAREARKFSKDSERMRVSKEILGEIGR